ncbi:MAG TPA: RagB/SusD family nutrient uptake outer membrane protein [Cyclobacteriaceae bacterium]|nr:RagB/SusD family nutrient uptake outer membrane protein [Cyclobacteriaceae bacterium]
MKNTAILGALISFVLIGCNEDFLEELPQDAVGAAPVFGSESGLQLYSYSFYNVLPDAMDIFTGDYISDYGSRRDITLYLSPGAFSANESSGWSWSELRNINHFIVNNDDEDIPLEVRQHYQALARFFRAWFYFDKVKRFGDVPWIGEALDVDDPALYNARDPRTLVMDSVIADLNYATTYLKPAPDPTRSLITRNVAHAFLSRVALFEGTFRKYHTNYGLEDTSDDLLAIAVTAAEAVMESGHYQIHTGSGPAASYRDLFVSESPVASEVILAWIANESLSVMHAANWHYTSSTTGIGFNLTRDFVNTYLNLDGTPFTNTPGWETTVFSEEVRDRDRRLSQTIRTEGYSRISGGTTIIMPPSFDYTNTGYHPIKLVQDDMIKDTWTLTTSSLPIIRYAEILLNFAEAKAELGTLTDADWAKTVGTLRARGGITGGLNNVPIVADSYLQEYYFPEISDPALLEIRRERGIELVMEGFRFYDLVRWKKGELMEKVFNGIYVPALNLPMDLNEDGDLDVAFYQNSLPNEVIPGVEYLNVAETTEDGSVNPRILSNGDHGEILWFWNHPRVWEEKHYLYPIPETDRLFNPALGQNPGW